MRMKVLFIFIVEDAEGQLKKLTIKTIHRERKEEEILVHISFIRYIIKQEHSIRRNNLVKFLYVEVGR